MFNKTQMRVPTSVLVAAALLASIGTAPRVAHSQTPSRPSTAAKTATLPGYQPWLASMNGMWEGGPLQRIRLYFSPLAMVIQLPTRDDPVEMQIVAADSANDSVTFNLKLPPIGPLARRPSTVPVKGLGQATPDQQIRLLDAGIDVQEFNRLPPDQRGVLVATQLRNLSKKIELSEQSLEQIRSRPLPATADINYRESRIAEYLQRIPQMKHQLDDLSQLETELTDRSATREAQSNDAARRDKEDTVEVTIRRNWNEAHTQFNLIYVEPFSSIQLGFLRRLLPNEEAEMARFQTVAQQNKSASAEEKVASIPKASPQSARPRGAPLPGWDPSFANMTGAWRTDDGVILLLFSPQHMTMGTGPNLHHLEVYKFDKENDILFFSVEGAPDAHWGIGRIWNDDHKSFRLTMIAPSGKNFNLKFERQLADVEIAEMLK